MLLNKLSFVSATNSSCFEQGVIQLGLTTYCCIFVARVVHDLMFFRLRLNSINMIAQYPNLLPSRSLLVRTCILAQPQSMKFLQQPSSKTLTLHKSDVPRRSVGWKQPPSMHMYVHAYAWSVETHWQNKFLHTRIYTYNETKIAPSAHAIGYACEKLYITYIMYDLNQVFFLGVGVDKWCSWWKYAEVCFVLSNFMHAPCQVWATIQAIHEWVYKSRMSFLALAITWSYWSFKQHMTYLMFGCEKKHGCSIR